MTAISRFSMILVACAALSSTLALADDAAARAKLEEAKTLYANRGNAANIVPAIEALDLALSAAESADLKYDILVLKARTIYWQGFTVPGSEENNSNKVPVFEKGIAAAAQAKAINKDWADAYYVYALNLGRWGLAKGKLNSLARLGELKDNLNKARALDAKDGTPGEQIDGYGPNRIYGRMYWSLPGVVGGDNKKSLQFLKVAFEGARHYAINVVYYAETLNDTKSRDVARQILTDLLAHDSETYNKDRIPEAFYEFRDAKALLDRINAR